MSIAKIGRKHIIQVNVDIFKFFNIGFVWYSGAKKLMRVKIISLIILVANKYYCDVSY